MSENGARLGRVLRNPAVRRIQLALLGSTLGDWAYGIAVVVWAYGDGGAKAVGAYQAVRFIAVALTGPFGGALADRLPRRGFMVVSDLLRLVLVAAAAVVIGTDGPALAVYTLAVVAAVVGAPARAALAGLMPTLVEDAADLTTSNALAGNVESVMIFAGPALAAVMIAVWDVQTVFWLNAATFGWSALLVLGVRVPAVAEQDDEDEGEAGTGFFTDSAAGLRLLVRDRDLRSVATMAAGHGFVWGVLTVVTVLFATQVLHTGSEGVGYLNSVLGVATAAGGLVILAGLAGKRLGHGMLLGALGWVLPLLAIAAFPSPVVALVAMAVIGLSEPLASLGTETIPQRIAPPEFMSRIFAAVASATIGAMAIGAALAPVLVRWLGVRGAVVVPAAVLLLITVANRARLGDLDRRLAAPPELALLRGVPAFADLPSPALERLAQAATHLEVTSGTLVLAEGGASDRFYVIASGEVAVSQGGRQLRTEGPGEYFGEIGLLRNVLRTATVTTTVASELLVLDRADFLAAVGAAGDGRAALDDVIASRLYA